MRLRRIIIIKGTIAIKIVISVVIRSRNARVTFENGNRAANVKDFNVQVIFSTFFNGKKKKHENFFKMCFAVVRRNLTQRLHDYVLTPAWLEKCAIMCFRELRRVKIISLFFVLPKRNLVRTYVCTYIEATVVSKTSRWRFFEIFYK